MGKSLQVRYLSFLGATGFFFFLGGFHCQSLTKKLIKDAEPSRIIQEYFGWRNVSRIILIEYRLILSQAKNEEYCNILMQNIPFSLLLYWNNCTFLDKESSYSANRSIFKILQLSHFSSSEWEKNGFSIFLSSRWLRKMCLSGKCD